MSGKNRWQRWAWTLGKVAVSVGILTWLLTRPATQEAFGYVAAAEKNWAVLGLALLLCSATVAATIVRWHLLLAALGVPISTMGTMRLGFLGYMLNYVSLGSVGGDAFKAIFLIRDYPGHRAESVASVLVDRVLGMLGLFWVVSLTTLLTGFLWSGALAWQIQAAVWFAWACAISGVVGIGLLLSPLFRERLSDERLHSLPRPVVLIVRLIRAVRMYRHHPLTLISSLVQSMVTHMLFAMVVLLIAYALTVPQPTVVTQLIVVPLANLAGSVPLPAGGLGAMEAAMALLYEQVSVEPPITQGEGTLLAFSFRAVMILVALIGFGFYAVSRNEVQAVYEEAEEEDEADLTDQITTDDPAANGPSEDHASAEPKPGAASDENQGPTLGATPLEPAAQRTDPTP